MFKTLNSKLPLMAQGASSSATTGVWVRWIAVIVNCPAKAKKTKTKTKVLVLVQSTLSAVTQFWELFFHSSNKFFGCILRSFWQRGSQLNLNDLHRCEAPVLVMFSYQWDIKKYIFEKYIQFARTVFMVTNGNFKLLIKHKCASLQNNLTKDLYCHCTFLQQQIWSLHALFEGYWTWLLI